MSVFSLRFYLVFSTHIEFLLPHLSYQINQIQIGQRTKINQFK